MLERPASKTPLDPALIKKGHVLFQQNGCAGCHKVGGQGGAVGPPLDGESTRHPDLKWQVSHLKDPPGVTRGEHYHHSKTEKFLVVRGTARFGFRHVVTDETFEILVRGDASRVVETVPGWAHNITNVGGEEMVVLLWANEVFDPQRPDTIASAVNP